MLDSVKKKLPQTKKQKLQQELEQTQKELKTIQHTLKVAFFKRSAELRNQAELRAMLENDIKDCKFGVSKNRLKAYKAKLIDSPDND